MQTAEIVRRIYSGNRPVTAERALKILHLLDRPAQAQEVIAAVPEPDRQVLIDALTPAVIQAHFQTRTR